MKLNIFWPDQKFPKGPQSAKGEIATLDTHFVLLGAYLHDASAASTKEHWTRDHFLLGLGFFSDFLIEGEEVTTKWRNHLKKGYLK